MEFKHLLVVPPLLVASLAVNVNGQEPLDIAYVAFGPTNISGTETFYGDQQWTGYRGGDLYNGNGPTIPFGGRDLLISASGPVFNSFFRGGVDLIPGDSGLAVQTPFGDWVLPESDGGTPLGRSATAFSDPFTLTISGFNAGDEVSFAFYSGFSTSSQEVLPLAVDGVPASGLDLATGCFPVDSSGTVNFPIGPEDMGGDIVLHAMRISLCNEVVVPEPSSCLLFAVGGALFFRRRR